MPGDDSADRIPPDPVIELYKKDIDRTLIDENLKLTPQERIDKLIAFLAFLEEAKKAGERAG
jgi:hypothetical protein